MDPEGRIFFGQAREGERHLLFVGLRFGLDRDLHDRLGELDRLEDHGLLHVGERVAGEGLLQTDRGGDVAGRHLFDFLTVVRVHQKDPGDPLSLVLRRVHDGVARAEHA